LSAPLPLEEPEHAFSIAIKPAPAESFRHALAGAVERFLVIDIGKTAAL
jgi:hypothetical protein